jgi:hypothetical protein
MRKLIDGTNVNAGDADYPKGRPRDKVGGTPGTIYNEVLHGDIIQFFQKLVIDGPIVENDTPDNVTNGYQLIDALVAKIDALNGGLRKVVVPLPAWDMDLDSLLTVGTVSGVTAAQVKSVKAGIYANGSGTLISLGSPDVNGAAGGDAYIDDVDDQLKLLRATGGRYDNTNFNGTASSRGLVVIEYVKL